jgi:hypothetical protein
MPILPEVSVLPDSLDASIVNIKMFDLQKSVKQDKFIELKVNWIQMQSRKNL